MSYLEKVAVITRDEKDWEEIMDVGRDAVVTFDTEKLCMKVTGPYANIEKTGIKEVSVRVYY